jgi:hypothetical protein
MGSIPPLSTTGIGSLPHLSAPEACDLVLKTFDVPFWPQLPKRSFRESMIVQYSEGMPYVRVNEEDQVAWVTRDQSDELERFYESHSETSRIAMSEDYALGLHTFLGRIRGRRFGLLKGHVTGPLTFTLGLKDNHGRYIYFDEELREIAAMVLQAKARWQVDVLRQHAEGAAIFIDEPILSAVGSSAYLGVDTGEVSRLLRAVVSAIEEAGGIPGIHCCGRADWPVVLGSGARIVSFDAYEYFDTLNMYKDEVRDYLDGGGYLAWGIVPTSESIRSVDEDRLMVLMRRNLEQMTKYLPSERVLRQIMLTPACGAGSLSIGETVKAFQLLIRLKEALS